LTRFHSSFSLFFSSFGANRSSFFSPPPKNSNRMETETLPPRSWERL
jgi:hypothetical protein